MVIVWIVIALIVVAVAVAIVVRRSKKHGDETLDKTPTELHRGMGSIDPGPIMEVMPPSSDEFTDAPLAEVTGFDATDDLLDPSNPQHHQWVAEHPGDATNLDVGGDDRDGDVGTTTSSS